MVESDPSLLLRNVGLLVTLNSDLGTIRDAAVCIENNRICWVGRDAELPEKYAAVGNVKSLPDRIVIPGLVNTHHHMFQCLTRCVAQESLLFGWLTTLYPAWEFLTGADVYVGCKLAMAELILSGCTTTSDHHYVFPNDVQLDDCIKAGRDIGIRFHPTRGAMTLGKSKGGLPPDTLCEESEAVLKDMDRLIAEYHDNSRFSMLRIGLSPVSPFSVEEDLLKKTAVMAQKTPGVRLHFHLAENQEDIDYSLEKYGCRPGEFIKRTGWNVPEAWFAHCCMLDNQEMQQFADNGIGVAHCPSSNMRLASGIAPVRKMLDTGVNVGLGVDGSASNDCGHMLAEVRQTMLLQRAGGNPKALSAREALDIGIKGGARNLGRDDIGEIAPGFAADMVAWRTDTVGFSGTGPDPVAALVFCTPSLGFVDLSIINGKVIVEDGKFASMDLQGLIADHSRVSQKICSRIKPQAPHDPIK
ncbi:hypothetical protein WJX84_001132 [Apatococcus fuscideae]|uniref:Amidohydrolase-related domain-containing protein n=1 Tax=Apatococcus fuscideae TaxID=2026836 RepID=A0AAW1SI21_9CHLO